MGWYAALVIQAALVLWVLASGRRLLLSTLLLYYFVDHVLSRINRLK